MNFYRHLTLFFHTLCISFIQLVSGKSCLNSMWLRPRTQKCDLTGWSAFEFALLIQESNTTTWRIHVGRRLLLLCAMPPENSRRSSRQSPHVVLLPDSPITARTRILDPPDISRSGACLANHIQTCYIPPGAAVV